MRRCTRCGITEATHPMEIQDGELVCYECAAAERDARAEREG